MNENNRFYVMLETAAQDGLDLYVSASQRNTANRAAARQITANIADAAAFRSWVEARSFCRWDNGKLRGVVFPPQYAFNPSWRPVIVGGDDNAECDRMSAVLQEAGFGLTGDNDFFTIKCPFHHDPRYDCRIDTHADRFECVGCGEMGGLRKMAERLCIRVAPTVKKDDGERNYILEVIGGVMATTGNYLKPNPSAEAGDWYLSRPGKRGAIQFDKEEAQHHAQTINATGVVKVAVRYHVFRGTV